MKFSQELKKRTVPEWKRAYLDYELLKKILIPYKITQKLCVKTKFYRGEETSNLVGMNTNDEQFEKFRGMFEDTIVRETDKMNFFFQYKLLRGINTWKSLYECYLHINFKRKRLSSDFDKDEKLLKTAFHSFYRQIRLLKSYVAINKQGVENLLKKYKRNIKSLITKDQLVEKIGKKNKEGFLARNEGKLDTLIAEVEEVYLSFFYTRFNRKAGREELESAYDYQAYNNNLFFFGIFTGLAIFLILQIIYSVSDLEYTKNDNYKLIFPIYRGIGLIILYQWLLGWNVYVWNIYQVNYKLIFKFNHHFSTLSQILERAAVFTCIFLLSFFIFTIVQGYNYPTINGILPLLVWIFFLGYLFFPSDKWFNPEGRRYFYKLFKYILCMPFKPMEFRISWATDQLVSFITPLKDLVTALLFYTCDFSNQQNSMSRTSSSTQLILTGSVMASLPSIMRIIQCFRAMYDEGHYFKTNNFYNFLKYLSTLITTTLSFVLSIVKTDTTINTSYFLAFWIASSVVSTCYSYYWDITKDWGLMTNSKNKFLRDHIVYGNPNIYYAAFASNFLLRLAWVFNISPGFQAYLTSNKDMFTFIIGLLEMFRRCQWNLFRVELEHVKNCDSFKAVDDTSLAQQHLSSCISKDPVIEQKVEMMKQKDNRFIMPKQAVPKNLIENIKDCFFARYYTKDESSKLRKINKEINTFKTKMYAKHIS